MDRRHAYTRALARLSCIAALASGSLLSLTGCGGHAAHLAAASFCSQAEAPAQQVADAVYGKWEMANHVYPSEQTMAAPLGALRALANSTATSQVKGDANSFIAYGESAAMINGQLILDENWELSPPSEDFLVTLTDLIDDCKWDTTTWPDYGGPTPG